MHLTFLCDFLWLHNWTFRYCSISIKHFHSSVASSLFQLVLKSTSASLDAGPCPMQGSSARSPDSLLFLQGVLSLLPKWRSAPPGWPGGSCAAPLGTLARASSRAATFRPFCTVGPRAPLHCGPTGLLDFLQTFIWSEVRSVFTRRRFWLQQDGAT